MKRKKRCLAVGLSLCLALVLTVSPAMAASNETVYSITEAYQYPMEQSSDEWKALETPEERMGAFSVPDDIINNMTTEALLETVITNPYFANIWAFDSIETGIEVVSSYVDGLAELVEREDFADAVSKMTEQASLMTLDGEDLDELSLLKVDLMEDVFEATAETTEEVSPYYSIKTVTTPNGSSVSAFYGLTYVDHGLSEETAKAEQTALLTNHPSATIIRNISAATDSYNCHSYAWYSTSASNPYWINDPTKYMTDGSYSSTTASVGAKVYWKTSSGAPVHSGIIYSVPTSGKVSVVTSKWGPYGLIRHNINDSPYAADSSSTAVWK